MERRSFEAVEVYTREAAELVLPYNFFFAWGAFFFTYRMYFFPPPLHEK